ncbi:MAG: TrbC/VirB2 family protein [Acidobacteria bacterium]|nr:TrbC/VirB2 family protein [Acidobacteriota bacterium]
MTPETVDAKPQAPPSRLQSLSIRFTTLLFLVPALAMAQGTSPWQTAVTRLQTVFTGPIARGLSLVALVIGGLMFAFGEGGSKKLLAGIIFGLGMTMGAANFLNWLF